MKCMSRTGRMFGAVLACGILLISLLYAEEPVIRIQDPNPQQPQAQDTKTPKPKGQKMKRPRASPLGPLSSR